MVRVIQGGEVLQTVQLPGVVDDVVTSMSAALLCIDTNASVPQLMLGGGSHLSSNPEGYCQDRTSSSLPFACNGTSAFACDIAPALYTCPPSPPPAAPPPPGCVDIAACPVEQTSCLLSSTTCDEIMRLPGAPADGVSTFTCACPTNCTVPVDGLQLMPTFSDECEVAPTEAECHAWADAQGLPFVTLTDANEWDNYPITCFQSSRPARGVWNPVE